MTIVAIGNKREYIPMVVPNRALHHNDIMESLSKQTLSASAVPEERFLCEWSHRTAPPHTHSPVYVCVCVCVCARISYG